MSRQITRKVLSRCIALSQPTKQGGAVRFNADTLVEHLNGYLESGEDYLLLREEAHRWGVWEEFEAMTTGVKM